jgi:hypothetical protein
MKDWFNRFGIAVAVCFIGLSLVKFGEFAFGGIFVIFILVGGLILLMGHKNLGWGIVIGTLLFITILLLFGYLFMEGWPGPQEYLEGKRYQKLG